MKHGAPARVSASAIDSRVVTERDGPGPRWAESVPKRRIGGKKITHSLALLAPLRFVPRRTAPLRSAALRAAALRSAGAAPLRSAPLAALVSE